MAIAQNGPGHVQRSGQAGSFEDGAASRPVEHLNRQVGVHDKLIARAEAVKEVEGRPIATHQDVLAIIDEIAGIGVVKGIGASAELPPPNTEALKENA